MSFCFGKSSPKGESAASPATSQTSRSPSPGSRVPSPDSGPASGPASPVARSQPTPAGSVDSDRRSVETQVDVPAAFVVSDARGDASADHIRLREALVQLHVADAKSRLYDELRAERDRLRVAVEEAKAAQHVAEAEAIRLRPQADAAQAAQAECARLTALAQAHAAAESSAQAELRVVRKAREAAAGAAQAAMDAAAAAQGAAQEASQCVTSVQQAQRMTHDALLADMATLQAELNRAHEQLAASQAAQAIMQEDLVDLRARVILQRRELEDARAALSEYDAGEDALDAALQAAARRVGAEADAAAATLVAKATSRTASIRRRTTSALQALRRAHAAEQAASQARERLATEEALVVELKAQLAEARLRAQCVQQPTQALVNQLTDAQQQAAQWRASADGAAAELAALREDFRRVLDSRLELDASLAKALTKMAAAGSGLAGARATTRPGRRTAPLRR